MKYLPCFLLLFHFAAFGQSDKLLTRNANKLLKKEQYRNALPLYEQALQKRPEDPLLLLNTGICYLNRYSKEKGLQFIEKSYELNPKVSPHILYWLGRAYHQNGRIDEAIDSYNRYKSNTGKRGQRSKQLQRFINSAHHAKYFIENPADYLVFPLIELNSPFSDHSPVLSRDGKTIYFTSRRNHKDSREEKDGEYFESVYYSKQDANGIWQEPRLFSFSHKLHDATVQLFGEDSKMLIYRNTRQGDIYQIEKKAEEWTEPQPLTFINTSDFEVDAFFNATEDTLYFASNKHKAKGDLDIYYVYKQGNDWSRPLPLTAVNTEEEEIAPFLSKDGQYFYFSSKGHNSMGGYDIFRCRRQADGTWSKPENMGYPVNTVNDDVYYHAVMPCKAYFSSYRNEGAGEKDLYTAVEIKPCKIKGLVRNSYNGKYLNEGQAIIIPGGKGLMKTKVEENISNGRFSAKVKAFDTYQIAIVYSGDTLNKDSLSIPLLQDELAEFELMFTVYLPDKVTDSLIVIDSALFDRKFSIPVVYFKSGSYQIDNGFRTGLKAFATEAEKNNIQKIKISGYTDSQGSETQNRILSQKRAEAVRNFLVQNGLRSEVIEVIGYGANAPVADNDTADGRKLNRRVEIILVP